MTAQVQALVAEVEKPGAIVNPDSPQSPASLSYVDPLATLPKTGLATQRWHPPDVDEAKPSVATGVSCPLASVLESSGQRVNQLVEDVAKFAAVEVLLHQRLDEFGVPTRTETRKFKYVASITMTEQGFMEVSEYRADRLERGLSGPRCEHRVLGLALVFHPHMQNEFENDLRRVGRLAGAGHVANCALAARRSSNRMHGIGAGRQHARYSRRGEP
jgi:hypothetical protein